MSSATQEVVMPGDRDYIDEGLARAERHANNGLPSDMDQVLETEPSHHGGGDYIPMQVGTIGRPLGRVVISPFAPDASGGFIVSRRLQMPRVIGHVAIPEQGH